MSDQVRQWLSGVFCSTLPPSSRLVCSVLAFGFEVGSDDPTIQDLCASTGLSKPCVVESIKFLLESNWIVREFTVKSGKRRARYSIINTVTSSDSFGKLGLPQGSFGKLGLPSETTETPENPQKCYGKVGTNHAIVYNIITSSTECLKTVYSIQQSSIESLKEKEKDKDEKKKDTHLTASNESVSPSETPPPPSELPPPKKPSPKPDHSPVDPLLTPSWVIDTYHEMLPELPRCIVRRSARTALIKARFEEYPRREDWVRFFAYVKGCDFLCGRVAPRQSDRKPFRASLDWMCLPRNLEKIMQGLYEDNRHA